MSDVWAITGAGSGLGLALARAALARGDRVLALVRRPASVAALEARAPGRVLTRALDVADRDAVFAAVRDGEAALGPIGIAVNNAGQVLESTLEEVDPEQARALFAVSLHGPLNLIQAVLPAMRARRAGRIVNISSGGGFVGLPALGIYCATKFALEGLSEALAPEVASLGIRVTIVEPGSFRTNLLAGNTHRTSSGIEDYEATCGRWRRDLAAMAGREPNDPARFADAMLALVDHPDPPLRLPLGGDAVGMVERKLAAIAADIASWREIGCDLGFVGADPAQLQTS